MTVKPHLRLGTRRSPLAMAQAVETRERLCAAHGWEQDAVELVPVIASGDKIQDRPLADIGGKAAASRPPQRPEGLWVVKVVIRTGRLEARQVDRGGQ